MQKIKDRPVAFHTIFWNYLIMFLFERAILKVHLKLLTPDTKAVFRRCPVKKVFLKFRKTHWKAPKPGSLF